MIHPVKKTYTSEDVAAMAGVSQATVSRVFAGGAHVSEKKKKKVLEAAQKLNYQPNAHARSLITRKTHMIGLVMRNIRNPFYSTTLELFFKRFSAKGYHLIFINSENEEINETEIAQLLQYNVEGVIITDALLSSAAALQFKRAEIVTVLFNRYVQNATAVSAVCCDNYLAARQMATYLVEHGHRSFAFISGSPDASTTVDRLKGFSEVLAERNIHDLLIEPGNYTYESGFQAAQELLSKNRNVDCIFCGNDIIALGAMDAIRVMGLKIPTDISVVGFDNIRMAAWPSYNLTTWEQPLDEMVNKTVEILLSEIENQDARPQTVILKGKMVTRNTVKRK